VIGPGDRIGPYEVLGQLGAGGMGEVYRARDARLGRDVAIKVLPRSVASDADRLRRFEQEARVTGSLNHPNIVAIHDFGTHDGMPFVVMELLDGSSLQDRLRSGPLPQSKAIEYAFKIATGLAAAHEKGIVHRDLKPANVFLTNDGQVKVLDFGLAKLERSELVGATHSTAPTAGGETQPGMVLGTVGYMAPEQVRGQPVDHRGDIFTFGTILYEMLTGQRAFRRDSAVETMHAVLREDPPPFVAAGRNIPPGLERIVLRCLEKEPEQRFHSARDLAFALDALSASSSALSQAGLAPPMEPAAARPRSRRTLAMVLGGCAAVVAIALLGTRFFGGGSPPPAFATLTVKTSPQKARVLVGSRAAQGPLAAFDSLPAGACSLRVELEGYTAETRLLQLEPGLAYAESVALKQVAGRQAPRQTVASRPPRASNATTGSLRVFSGKYSLEVSLDGRKTGKSTPCLLDGLTPGSHEVFLVERSGYEVRGDPRRIIVPAGDTVEVNFSGRILRKGGG
jgi:hypothetical protein